MGKGTGAWGHRWGHRAPLVLLRPLTLGPGIARGRQRGRAGCGHPVPHPVPHPIPCPIPCPIPSHSILCPIPCPIPCPVLCPIPSCAPSRIPCRIPSHAQSHGVPLVPSREQRGAGPPHVTKLQPLPPRGARDLGAACAPWASWRLRPPPSCPRHTRVHTHPKSHVQGAPLPKRVSLGPMGTPVLSPSYPHKALQLGGGAPWLTPCSPSPAQPQNPREIPQSWHVLGTRGGGEGGWEQRGRPPQWGPMAAPTDVTLVPPRAGGARC